MANTHISKAKIGQKGKKSEDKKVTPPGFEPGSLDPKSNTLPLSYGGKEFWGKKFMYLNQRYTKISLNYYYWYLPRPQGQQGALTVKIEQWGTTGGNVGPKGQQGGIVMGPTGTKGVIMGVMGSLKCEFVLV